MLANVFSGCLFARKLRRWGSLKNREGKTVAVGISAATSEGLDALRQAIAEYAAGFSEE